VTLMAGSEGDVEADARRVERKVIGVHTGTVIPAHRVWYRGTVATFSLSSERLLLSKQRHAPVKAGERR